MADDYDADDKAEAKEPTQSEAWEAVHKEALLEYERDYERERNNIDEAYEDLRFRRGNKSDQWTPEALEARKGRPCHVVNKLPQFIRQVTGDMRQTRPGIKVVPVDSGADIKTAEVRAGMIRYVENRSKAKHVYTTGADSQVTCGIGHWQITTEYAHAGTFNQEIRIVGIEDSVSVLWDADAILQTKDDADHCFVPVDMTLAKFKKQWPNAKAEGFDTRQCGTGTTSAFDNWHSDDYIRVVQYWKKKPMKRTLALLPDGSIEDLTDQVKDVPKEQLEAGLNFLREQKQARIEERDSYKICRYLITMAEVLDEQDWPGMFIPVVPVIGEEVRVGRDVYRHGIVRYARDLQRMVNYYASAETEVVALQPKAPYLGTKKMFQDHYDQWEVANTDNLPFLEYTPDPSAPGGRPERIQPPVASQAIQAGALNVSNDMKAVIGIYDASLGAKSNETSGIAIERRDQQGDTGTYVYHDNFALAIERTGEIVNELFPKIYDTQRTIRILGDDGKPDMVEINKPQVVNGVEKILNDMSSGSYDVMMEQGPSYTTKREAAQAGMTEFIRAYPPAAPVMGDLYAKAMDWPHAEEIGERLEELLPPPIKAKLEADRKQREQAAGQQQPPSPEQRQQEAAQQKQQQMAEQAAQMQMAEAQAKVEKAQAEAMQAKADAERAIADAEKAKTEALIKKAELARLHVENVHGIERDHIDMTRANAAHERDMAHSQDRHTAEMTLQGLGAFREGERHTRDMTSPEPAPAQ
ncbi:portal protein [Afipia sp. DC4300-2b1]|uniref:portal protein n=1 Tax=Afipia sp. DC4300-2b1 TaxID=2804672 RepID=UPI003CFAF816